MLLVRFIFWGDVTDDKGSFLYVSAESSKKGGWEMKNKERKYGVLLTSLLPAIYMALYMVKVLMREPWYRPTYVYLVWCNVE